ncbi:hypothetical protein WR25_14309 [Diploscapter pachys]|uniref:Uncharacterized protein n=1 Tax=Diploscapter pachys TaxID=2018661 RepID=A0A2A2KH56_9BILA|nr:hypothetical protein WR25_14309 [Diploscapter pachys]
MLQKSTIKSHKRLMRPIILYGLYHLEIINSTLIEYLVYTLFSFFPAISPLVTIYYVRPYKNFVISLFKLRPVVEPSGGLKTDLPTPSSVKY